MLNRPSVSVVVPVIILLLSFLNATTVAYGMGCFEALSTILPVAITPLPRADPCGLPDLSCEKLPNGCKAVAMNSNSDMIGFMVILVLNVVTMDDKLQN